MRQQINKQYGQRAPKLEECTALAMTAASAGQHCVRGAIPANAGLAARDNGRAACGRRCTAHMQQVVTRAAPTRGECKTSGKPGRGGHRLLVLRGGQGK
eukprot:4563455-Alexandrium_andersonii.AAC.1